MLNEYGFNYAFKQHPELLNHKHFVALFKQRLNDCCIQKWRAGIESNQVLNTLYKHIKTTFGIEFYLEHIISRKSRTILTKLRVSLHYLRIETGRYSRDRKKQTRSYL